MSILAFIVIGLVAGLIARAVVPGNQGMGIVRTTFLGILGSFVGGMVHSLIYSRGHWLDVHPTGLLFSIIGAIVVLALMSVVGRRHIRA